MKNLIASKATIKATILPMANCFISEPENDGPPSGFDYDIVMKSQDFEMEELLRDLKITNLSISKKTTKLTADFGVYYKLNFLLSKENEVWKIDNIINLGTTEN